jgi:hypothetical protein
LGAQNKIEGKGEKKKNTFVSSIVKNPVCLTCLITKLSKHKKKTRNRFHFEGINIDTEELTHLNSTLLQHLLKEKINTMMMKMRNITTILKNLDDVKQEKKNLLL